MLEEGHEIEVAKVMAPLVGEIRLLENSNINLSLEAYHLELLLERDPIGIADVASRIVQECVEHHKKGGASGRTMF